MFTLQQENSNVGLNPLQGGRRANVVEVEKTNLSGTPASPQVTAEGRGSRSRGVHQHSD